jgi:hypothetical protein
MAALIAKVVFWTLFAVIIACIEIEAEGKHGWAEKMPTWYRTTGFWAVLYGRLMGGKPLTGYHTFMFFFPALLFHAHFFMGVSWSATEELKAWAMYFVWCPLWDYYWFVLNPHYKGKFKKDGVWWHAKSYWVLGLFPIDYLIGLIVSLGFAEGAALVGGSQALLIGHLKLLGGFVIATVALHLLIAPAYRRWYLRMRLTDDRSKAPIFHKDAA